MFQCILRRKHYREGIASHSAQARAQRCGRGLNDLSPCFAGSIGARSIVMVLLHSAEDPNASIEDRLGPNGPLRRRSGPKSCTM